LAAQAGIGRWTAEQAKAAMQRCLIDWVSHRGGLGPSEERQALRQVQAFLEEHGSADFQRLDTSISGYESLETDRTVVHRAGYYDPNGDEGHGVFYVFPTVFNDRVCVDLNPKLVKQVLRQHGLLLADTGETKRLPGIKSPARYYQISNRIVGFDD